jgi:Bacterial PH domain
MKMRREFTIAPPDLRLVLLMPAISLLVGVIGIGLAAREEPRAWFVMIAIALAVAVLTWSVQRRRVALDGNHLEIAAGINNARIAVADLDLAAARSVNLMDVSALRPMLKTFGTSMPGYRAGHFRLRGRGRAFVLLTDHRKVLALPERSGRMLLLSLERPQALLDALKAVAEAPSHR